MPAYALGDSTPALPPPGAWWLAPDAQLIGDVHVAEDVGIWFGAVLRGDNEPIRIGPGSNVQEHAVIHADPGFPAEIGAEVTIGHRAIIHGARIGDGALIGAGALIAEGKEIPDYSLVVGAPGKVIRTLDEKTVARVKMAADRYHWNRGRYAAGMREITD